jgi:hypothetical protein
MSAHRATLAIIFVIAILMTAGVAFNIGPFSQSDNQFDSICVEELGAEWDAAGVAQHDDWTHYHVKCEQKTGWFGVEEQWVSVPAAEGSDA